MGRIKLKKRKKKNIFSKIIILFIVILIFSILFIKYYSNKASEILFSYAESETKRLTTLIINKAITTNISNMNTDNMFEIVKNSNNDIQLITFNSINVTKVLNKITDLIQVNLKLLEQGQVDKLDIDINTKKSNLKKGIIYEIPLGVITSTSFLSNLGPKIPVRLNLIGDVVTAVESKVSEYGINNAMLEVGIKVEVNSKINLPFISKTVKVDTTIPIIMKVIQGNIPNMYLDSITAFSNIVQKEIE